MASYPGAAFAVSLIVGVSKVVVPGISPQSVVWVTLVASALVSVLILFIGLDGETPEKRKARSPIGWVLVVAMALVNGLVLEAAAMGVEQVAVVLGS
jgi:hypothetical protein